MAKGLKNKVVDIIDLGTKDKIKGRNDVYYDNHASAINEACKFGHLNVLKLLFNKSSRVSIIDGYIITARAHHQGHIVEFLKTYLKNNKSKHDMSDLVYNIERALESNTAEEIIYYANAYTTTFYNIIDRRLDTLIYNNFGLPNKQQLMRVCADLLHLHRYLLNNPSLGHQHNNFHTQYCYVIIEHINNNELVKKYFNDLLSQQFKIDKSRLEIFINALFNTMLLSDNILKPGIGEIIKITECHYPEASSKLLEISFELKAHKERIATDKAEQVIRSYHKETIEQCTQPHLPNPYRFFSQRASRPHQSLRYICRPRAHLLLNKANIKQEEEIGVINQESFEQPKMTDKVLPIDARPCQR